MAELLQEYADAIRSRVCSVCLDAVMQRDLFVRCGLPADRRCPVDLYLPRVIEVVESVDSWLLEDYVHALRERVCAVCANAGGGTCVLRLQADCALDRYLALVIEAIDEVKTRRQAQEETAGIP
ncbi:MAG: hypothetical protein ONB48_16230 [candidate division KSB1 bacterium]|nr:hypothetical protein [candidate division KSB1 bacterium]MDZ7274281.1 hypothetical protein [candidate division KSB1 bacterium]MDZ7287197.1 hypothetical protein [candidate division KSB1 bacterium]MDZ7296878.1 hypothetical protein [candidate division KSB1 bacterium]MDZ7306017.1 hypothetical protein [candidate division KSB1 bacterium]